MDTMAGYYQTTELCHRMMQAHLHAGDLCIDATMGNGRDTLFLCKTVGESGRVIAFDIQQKAVDETMALLGKELPFENYELYLDGHEHMGAYAQPGSVSCVTFNLGYLPSGDHSISTRAESTLQALESALVLLKSGGVICLCIYSGGDTGYEERDAVLSWLRHRDPKKYLVLVTEYYNRPNDPPIPAVVIKR